MLLIFKKNNKKKGMTLIELLVVMAIISIITGVTWINFRHFGRTFDAERDIARMGQEIRASLKMAMAMEHFNIPPSCAGDNIIASYGVNFRMNETSYNKILYIINGDENSPEFGNIICSQVVDTIRLDQGSISLIQAFSGASSMSLQELDIIFVPPHPRTYIGRIDVHTINMKRRWRSRYDVAKISISLPGSNVARTVKVNRAGLIEIIRPGS